ncbi:hypothetical protein F2Q69_00010975 [Brassica cretica]|uniref:Uncharacterized protein n=1 Tax=Brassica cretica TaxID=69181 RepID=A0A8S9QY44_BRACR|nr:hypothetical protein F2Q69_00010975 [Brassica cretica]
MEFLETFGCIWSSKEVIKVIIGREGHGSDRSDATKSLCPTSQSDLTGVTPRSRSPFFVLRYKRWIWSDLPERPPQVTPEARSDVLERPPEVAARRLFGRTYDLSRAFWSFRYVHFTLSKPMFKYLL